MKQPHLLCMGLGAFTKPVARLSLEKGIQVTVWDPDETGLERLKEELAVKTRCASLRDKEVLVELLRDDLTLIAALSDCDEANLVTCQLAGELGCHRSLAILANLLYRSQTQYFGVTHAVFSISLLLNAVISTILLPGALPCASLMLGEIQMRTFRIPMNWDKSSLALAEMHFPLGIYVGCIRRLKEGLNPAKETSYKMMIPQGTHHLLAGDEVVCFGQPSAIRKLPAFFGLNFPKVKTVVISGVSPLVQELIRFLVLQEIPVQYVDEDKAMCEGIAQQFPDCLVLAQSVEAWSGSQIERAKQREQHNVLFIACGKQFITNFEQALFAKESGCEVIVTEVASLRERDQVEKLGMHALSSVAELVAEYVVSTVLSDPPMRYWSLYGGAVVLMELVVSRCSDVVGLPLAAFFSSILKNALILSVEHRGSVYSPTGESILFPGDRIVLIMLEQEREGVLKLFL